MKPGIDQSFGVQARQKLRGLLRFRYLSILLVLSIAGGLTYRMVTPADVPQQTGRRGGGPGGPGRNIPIPVSTATVRATDIPIKLNKLLGTVTPLASVSIKTQINGRLISVDFKEGQTVKRGDRLAQIDPRPYQHALDQVQGNLARDKATLANARIDLNRYKTLAAQDSIAVQQLDAQETLVRQLAGTVEADQAQVDTARLNLEFCRIVAPIDGRTGLRMVDPGNYVTVNDTASIVVITQVKPISVIFTIPEDELPQVAKRMASGAVLSVSAYDRDQRNRLATGRVMVIDNQIDTTTGTVKLRAIFDNDDESLFANQFVTLDLLVDVLKQVPAVASAAVQRGEPGTFVYVIGEENKVSVRPIKLGQADGEWVEVRSGLNLGDVVVTDGLDRLKDGAVVIPREAPAPNAAPANGQEPAPEKPRHKRDPSRESGPKQP